MNRDNNSSIHHSFMTTQLKSNDDEAHAHSIHSIGEAGYHFSDLSNELSQSHGSKK